MTVPDVRVTSPRRTVTVAGALVAGQALLCVVIGFVTFGGRDEAAPSARAAVPRIAVPPTIIAPPSPPAAGEKRAAVSSTTTPRRTSPAPTTSERGRGSPAGSTASQAGSPPAAAPVPETPVTSPPDLGLLPPSPTSAAPEPGDTPVPAVLHERCDSEGAISRTATGKVVRCERDRDGDLRWRSI